MRTSRRITRIERLTKKEESKSVKRIVYLSIVSLILAVLFLTQGISLLGRFADFLQSVFRRDSSVILVDNQPPSPPRLDDLPVATNSAQLAISGFSDSGTKVEIYLDNKKVQEVEVIDGKFRYENVNLADGENKITAKAIKNNSLTSDSSPTKSVILDKDEPKLEVETPVNGQSFSGDNHIKVSGKTETQAQVFANGFLASIDYEGKFEVFVPVLEGETTIEVKAIDEAGNTKVETRKVNFKR